MDEQDNVEIVSQSETVVIEMQIDSVTDSVDDGAAAPANAGAPAESTPSVPPADAGTTTADTTTVDETAQSDDANSAADSTLTSGPSALRAQDEAIYTIRLLTAVAVGAIVAGGDQLVTRLKAYEAQLQDAQAAEGDEDQTEIDEDEFDRLRYAVIGLIFDTQNIIGRSIALTARVSETSLDVANTVTKPFRNFFLFRPVTKRVEKRFDQMAEQGQDSFARWINIGREVEPEGRQLATMTYNEIVDEFISTLAENPELKELVAQQSISLAAGVRDEVRERTVTSDNVLEDIARRILRRQPRPELAEPPPEVQRWAGVTPEEIKDLEQEKDDEQQPDSTQ